MDRPRHQTASQTGIPGQPWRHPAAAGRYDEALQVFDRAAQLNPNEAGPWRDLGHILVDLNRQADALLSFQHALKLDPRNWELASKCGVILHKTGRFEEAKGYFDLCNELRPDHAMTLYMRSRALLDLGSLEEALADGQRAHQLDPANPEICNGIGAILRSQGHEAKALPWFERTVELAPNSVEGLTNGRYASVSCSGSMSPLRPMHTLRRSILAMPKWTGICRCYTC